ncbi:hypothetical protein BJ138DRAFT_331229 [Hygrophoropsis aurantiaca]|uniref:Uncharacterized protein n=1 Tax=Hygrophoropsis aurantiaca TaxID=72124 RepID=A0ACB8AQ16_9AGAM|nr:hypothetical protein BJ138DRAFT_331229 [Hygrophoropsis aurantiaca]
MCHRLLQFSKSTTCGHLTFIRDMTIDCHKEDCHLSGAHPASCGSQMPCNCRRYYGSVSHIRVLSAKVDVSCHCLPLASPSVSLPRKPRENAFSVHRHLDPAVIVSFQSHWFACVITSHSLQFITDSQHQLYMPILYLY